MAGQLVRVDLKALSAAGELQNEKLISLPQWLEERLTSLVEVDHRTEEGKFVIAKALPADMIPDKTQKDFISRKIAIWDAALNMTPKSNQAFAAKATEIVGKMMLVLGGREAGQFAAAARGEAYMIALEDIPIWAIEEAMRRWYRRGCDTESEKFDYRWMPDPGSLRTISHRIECWVRYLRRQADLVLHAPPIVEISEEDRAKMRGRVEELLLPFHKSRVV